MTWVVPEGMSEKKIQTELNKAVVLFEKQCKEGIVADGKQTFEKYANYSHIMQKADEVASDTLANIFLRNEKKAQKIS